MRWPLRFAAHQGFAAHHVADNNKRGVSAKFPQRKLTVAYHTAWTMENKSGGPHRGITISMDCKGWCMDNIFVERLWRSLKYEEVYLNTYADIAEANAGIGAWLDFTSRCANTRASAIARRANLRGRSVERWAVGAADRLPCQSGLWARRNARRRSYTHRCHSRQGV